MLGPNWEEEAREAGWLEPSGAQTAGDSMAALVCTAQEAFELLKEEKGLGFSVVDCLGNAIAEARRVLNDVLP